MSTDITIRYERLPHEAEIPAHVPSELIMVPEIDVANALVDPFLPAQLAFDSIPALYYSPAGSAGGRNLNGCWCVTRNKDIRQVYQNDALYSTEGTASFNRLVGETFPMIPLGIDPPEHAKYRTMLNPKFSPRAINSMEASIRSTINELIDGFIDKGECDIAYDYGRLYPVKVFLDLMGFPQSMLEEFLSWEYAILHSNFDIEKVQWGIGSAIEWLRDFAKQAKENPQDDLTGHIVTAKIDGRPMTDDEIIGTLTFLWIGGLDTVAATTALMFRRLALQPELQQQLRDNPDLIPQAIEEFLRVQPLVNSPRVIKKDHEIQGVKVKAGDNIICINSFGNFDPSEYDNPLEIRLDREPNRHFTLAGGHHRCLGSHLARRELGIALGDFLARVPFFSAKPDADLSATPGLKAVANFPIVWDVTN